jgi:hypothetical protein
MSTPLVTITVLLTKTTANLPSTNAAFLNTSVVVTDSTGVAQPAVLLTGAETPTPWSFTASVATGAGTVVATDMDVNGLAIGTPVSQTFTEAGSPPTFPQTSAITVTP